MRISWQNGGTWQAEDLIRILTEQWELLREYLEELDDSDLARPSLLEGWSIAELVAHLGRGLNSISAMKPEPAQNPQSWGEFLAGYAVSAEEIKENGQQLAAEHRDDRLETLDQEWKQAREHLDELYRGLSQSRRPPVVRGRRGPILLPEYIGTRILELVVHGDDIARVLEDEAPVSDRALSFTVHGLLAALDEYLAEEAPTLSVELDIPPLASWKAGPQSLLKGSKAQTLQPWEWIRVAAGRAEWLDVADPHGVSLDPYLPVVP